MYLDPGETAAITVMYEYAPDHLTSDLYPKELLPKYREMQRVPNRVAFASFIENPRDNPRHSLKYARRRTCGDRDRSARPSSGASKLTDGAQPASSLHTRTASQYRPAR